MKALNRSVETLGLWNVTSSVTFIKSANQSSIKLCLFLRLDIFSTFRGVHTLIFTYVPYIAIGALEEPANFYREKRSVAFVIGHLFTFLVILFLICLATTQILYVKIRLYELEPFPATDHVLGYRVATQNWRASAPIRNRKFTRGHACVLVNNTLCG